MGLELLTRIGIASKNIKLATKQTRASTVFCKYGCNCRGNEKEEKNRLKCQMGFYSLPTRPAQQVIPRWHICYRKEPRNPKPYFLIFLAHKTCFSIRRLMVSRLAHGAERCCWLLCWLSCWCVLTIQRSSFRALSPFPQVRLSHLKRSLAAMLETLLWTWPWQRQDPLLPLAYCSV